MKEGRPSEPRFAMGKAVVDKKGKSHVRFEYGNDQ